MLYQLHEQEAWFCRSKESSSTGGMMEDSLGFSYKGKVRA